jgi:hypothetical protein
MEVAHHSHAKYPREESGSARTALPTRPVAQRGNTQTSELVDASYASSDGSRSPGTESVTTSVVESNPVGSPSLSPLPYDVSQDERASGANSSAPATPNQSGQVCR